MEKEKDINRIKVVLVEKKRTNKWLAKQLEKDPATVSKDLRYILDPEDVCGKGCINETFRVLKERELRELGEYRTKRLVMEAWNKFEFDNKLKMLCYEK